MGSEFTSLLLLTEAVYLVDILQSKISGKVRSSESTSLLLLTEAVQVVSILLLASQYTSQPSSQ